MRLRRIVAISLLAVVAAACGGSAAGAPAGPPSATPAVSAAGSRAASPGPSSGSGTAIAELALTAHDLAFDRSSLTAPANTPFTIAFTNEDAGIAHDVSIETSSDRVVFAGQSITSGATTYSVPALAPGTYRFFCSEHPTLMHGTLIVR